MENPYYESTVPLLIKSLSTLHGILDKAAAYADSKKFDVKILLNARLSPDQYHFIKQVQVACDNAKGCGARLAGKEVPKHEDTEQTVTDLKQRLDKTISYLKTIKPSDFDGVADRKITLPWMPDKYLYGHDYATQFVMQNFYFHLTTAYAILRHNGVDLGKGDYLGQLNWKNK